MNDSGKPNDGKKLRDGERVNGGGKERNGEQLQRFSKLLRIITLPQFMAAVMLSVLRFSKGCFPGASFYVSLFCLTVFPMLSYAVWRVVPSLYKKGRKTQRAIAVAFSFAGYAAGTVYCFVSGAGAVEKTVFLTYLLSGLVIALSGALVKVRISGHACGLSGPLGILVWKVGPWFIAGYAILALVFWSSIRLRRHSLRELILGTALPLLLLMLIIGVACVSGVPLR